MVVNAEYLLLIGNSRANPFGGFLSCVMNCCIFCENCILSCTIYTSSTPASPTSGLRSASMASKQTVMLSPAYA